jgi:hypothetical protein
MPTPSSNKLLRALVACACLAGVAASEPAAAQEPSLSSGGAVFVPPPPPPEAATLVDGRVIAPASAPTRVRRVIEAANRLVEKPYRYGGGHRRFSRALDSGYDCSGAVSYALYGGRFLRSPLPSGALMTWGEEGPGSWITVYAHGGHAYVVVAGLRFDTSGMGEKGPRWRPERRSPAGYTARHPAGL